MVVVGSVDGHGTLWASVLYGRPGFARSSDGSTVRIDAPCGYRDMEDPLWGALRAGVPLGLLFIDLGSRRRYRVNGVLREIDEGGFEVAVREAFPNCPKYIQRRQLRALDEAPRCAQSASGTVLAGSVAAIVQQADTLFVASRHPSAGLDVSHRGGDRGFARIVDPATLRIPDYAGNSLFNTLGNFAVDPRAAIAVPDFGNGRLLQLTGTATLRWDDGGPDDVTGGTGRSWDFRIRHWLLRDAMQRASWEYIDASPYNPHPRT
jgi:predicted pyridoxine 5'-phosphate oxidase superfamily flavin-nucleotide-binding protein